MMRAFAGVKCTTMDKVGHIKMTAEEVVLDLRSLLPNTIVMPYAPTVSPMASWRVQDVATYGAMCQELFKFASPYTVFVSKVGIETQVDLVCGVFADAAVRHGTGGESVLDKISLCSFAHTLVHPKH